MVEITNTTATLDIHTAKQKAVQHLITLQKTQGDFEGEMVWCTMILAQAVIVRTIIGKPYDHADRSAILKHFKVTQSEEGTWGMHPESQGYVFFTTLAYIALRLLDLPPDDPMLAKARTWLHQQPEGVEGIPTWGKFWLAIIGLYEYEGLNAIPPELFLMPEWLPFHPSKFYCHTRLIYLGIGYICGQRFIADLPGTLKENLREELYTRPYASIPFATLRHRLAASDVYVPITPLLRTIYDGLSIFERYHPKKLRAKALKVCLDRIVYEQKTTRHQGISPVNGLLNTLSLFIADPKHPELEASLSGVEAWRWEDEAEGLRYVGARSNTWDTGFVLQALLEQPKLDPEIQATIQKAHQFLDGAQMQEELPDHERFWRDPALGGWCFSDGEHRWPVSDCTAEALSGLLMAYEHPDYQGPKLSPERLRNAVDFILSRQNKDGGFGTYERRRGGRLLELINPSEMFGQCMTELSYIECTASSIAALCHYRKHHEDTDGAIDRAIQKALELLKSKQLADGSFPGFWGINYTYAIFHVARALRMAGLEPNDPILQKAATFLKQKQRPDGGWSEHYTSCLEERYIEHPQTQAVMTSWALMALIDIVPIQDPAIMRGMEWLITQQMPDGGWPKQAVNGVFFGAAMLDYRLYHTYFPVWVITRYTVANSETQLL
jgi:lanosterol synthase